MNSIETGLLILATTFCGALLGMLMGRVLPEHHLSSDTKTMISGAMAVVGTLSALVLGLLLATASSSFATRNQEVMEISANLTRIDRLLRRFGSAADDSRNILRQYAAMKMHDLFPQGTTSPPTFDNPKAIILLEELENGLLSLKPVNNAQQWLQSQALQLTNEVATTRWALVQQSSSSIPLPFLFALVFWLTILFASFGLFAPRNLTATAALFLCAVAVSGAVWLILEMETPFQGIVQISKAPMRHAVQEINR